MMNDVTMQDIFAAAAATTAHYCPAVADLECLNFEDLQWSNDEMMESIISTNNLDFLSKDLFHERGIAVEGVERDKEDFNRVLEQWTGCMGNVQNDSLHDLNLDEVASVIEPQLVGCLPIPMAPTSGSNFKIWSKQSPAVAGVAPDSSVLEALDVNSLLEQFEATEDAMGDSVSRTTQANSASGLALSHNATSNWRDSIPWSAGYTGRAGQKYDLSTMELPRFSIILKREPAPVTTPLSSDSSGPNVVPSRPLTSKTIPAAVQPSAPKASSVVLPIPKFGRGRPPLRTKPTAAAPLRTKPPVVVPLQTKPRFGVPLRTMSLVVPAAATTILSTISESAVRPSLESYLGLKEHDYCVGMDTSTAEVPVISTTPVHQTPPSLSSKPVVIRPEPSSPRKMKSVLKPIGLLKREQAAVVQPDPESYYSKLPDYYTSIVPQKTKTASDIRCPEVDCALAPPVAVGNPSCRIKRPSGDVKNQCVRSNAASKENVVSEVGAPVCAYDKLPLYVIGIGASKLATACASTQMKVPPLVPFVKSEVPTVIGGGGGSKMASLVVPKKAVIKKVAAKSMVPRKPPTTTVKTKTCFYDEDNCHGGRNPFPSRLMGMVNTNNGGGPLSSDHHDGRSTRWQDRSRSSQGRVGSKRHPSSRSPSLSNSSRSLSRSPSRGRSSSCGSDSSWSSSSSHSGSRFHRRHRHRSRRTSQCSQGGRSQTSDIRKQQLERQQEEEKQKQIEDRRVVHVGNVKPGTTRSDLGRRFGVFGPIENITLHHRDHGDCYSFITFSYKVDAFQALEHGNDNPSLPQYELSLGGRRLFCLNRYSDLDSLANNYDVKPLPILRKKSDVIDFDSLLQAAKQNSRQSGH